MMKISYQIKVLLISCVITLVTLSFIQYYLIRNTYELTRDKYYTEVKLAMTKLTRLPLFVSMEEKIDADFKQQVLLYANKKINRFKFLQWLKERKSPVYTQADSYIEEQIRKNPLLKGVRYQSWYEEIGLSLNGISDTLLSASQRPVMVIGKASPTSNVLRLNNSNTVSYDNISKENDGEVTYSFNPRIQSVQVKYIDVSSWKTEMIKRMAGIFILALGLMITVIALFYLVFRSLLKQKKIADIKTDFANNITHELKTPLSSVELILKSLAKEELRKQPEKVEEMLSLLNRQYKKLKDTVDSVLESSMSETLKPELQQTDITAYLNQYSADLQPNSHTLTCDITPGTLLLRTNTSVLEKVLNNLIENAVKYTAAGSLITISAYRSGAQYTITITDSGSGIAPEYLNQIFDKFMRITEQNKHNDNVKGLGLGLYLSKNAIQQLGGTISVSSKTGKGCAFKIKLPIDEN